MKPPEIELGEPTVLHSVWELQNGYWELLTIVRLRCAIALARESPLTRLVFATGVNPNGVWGGIYDEKRTTPNEHQKADSSLQKRQARVLELLKFNPGQTKEAIAVFLDVRNATARQLLRSMEDNGDIHHRPHPMRNKTRLYYTGTPPSNPSTGAASNPSNPSLRSARSALPLKVYFVDPKTLQLLNR